MGFGHDEEPVCLFLDQRNKGGPENPKAKRQQTNLSDNWFISFLPLASIFLEDEH